MESLLGNFFRDCKYERLLPYVNVTYDVDTGMMSTFGSRLTRAKDDTVTCEFDVPGVKESDIDVALLGGYLTVTYTLRGQKQKYTKYVGSGYNASGASARLADGVLTVGLSRPEKTSETTIPIQVG